MTAENSLAKKIFVLGTILDILILDQISKWAIMEIFLRSRATGENGIGLIEWFLRIPPKLPFTQVEILPFFNLVVVWNQGVSFGMFNNDNALAPLVLIILSLLISAIFFVWLWRTPSLFQGLSLACIIGGALGNVIDRLRFEAVFDFLDFHIAEIHWPAFNVADSAIVLGVLALIFHSLFLEKKH